MGYLEEFRLHWRNLLAASLGLGLGSAIGHYTLSLFGPAMIADLGWTRAEFALVGAIPLTMLPLVPLAGRFTDRYGPRVAAMIGFIAIPLGFIAFSRMNGPIWEFYAITLAQSAFGMLTTTMVFARVVVERFDVARGFALSLVITAPPLAGAIAPPFIGEVIAQQGWRAGYLVLAAISALGGAVAITLMGQGRRRRKASAAEAEPKPAPSALTRAELLAIVRNPVFLCVLGGMFLVNVPQVFAGSQLKLVVMDGGASDTTATWLVSLYAIGVILGRFASGLALDRIPAHHVAIAVLGLPALGYVLLSLQLPATSMLIFAVMIIGLAQGAETDVGTFILSRRFPMGNFSLLVSLMTMALGFGSAFGALLLSATLDVGAGYTVFLLVSAVATILGAVLFGLTGRGGATQGEPPQGVGETSSPE